MPSTCRPDPSRYLLQRQLVILWAGVAISLQTPAVASAAFQLEDAVLDAITAQAGSQALASGGAFNAMVSPAPILVTAPSDVEITRSPLSVLGSLVISNSSPLVVRAAPSAGLDIKQLEASAEAKASGEAARTSTFSSSGVVPSSAGLAGSVTAETVAFSGSAQLPPGADRSLLGAGTGAAGENRGRVEAKVATAAQAFASGRLGTTGITLDFANVANPSARSPAESSTEQRLRATASDSFVTAHAFYSATSCCSEVVREATVKAIANGPHTLKTGWSSLSVDGSKTTVFGSVFVLATDRPFTPSIADNSLRLQGIGLGR